MTPDVNVLLAAARSDHIHHVIALAWLEQAIADAGAGAPLRLQPMVIAGFLRLATHPKVFVQPMPVNAALRFLDALIDAPGVEVGTLGGEWLSLRALCENGQLAGNAIPDAWLAAAVIRQGEHLASFDSDFKRLLSRSQFTHLRPASVGQ